MFEEKIYEWAEKVINAHKISGMTNTYQMMVDIDKIIAEGFDHDPFFKENL